MKLDISSMALGEKPTGFTEALTGQGDPVHWQVLEDDSAPGGKVIAETSRDTADHRFPLCIYDGFTGRDVETSVRFKAVNGQVDQAAGLVARVQDSQNYYVVRANALENNVRLYKVIDSVRRQLAGFDLEVTSGIWHTLSLKVVGDGFEVTFDDRQIIQAHDMAISAAGKVGLWTKADSLTHFVAFDIRSVSADMAAENNPR